MKNSSGPRWLKVLVALLITLGLLIHPGVIPFVLVVFLLIVPMEKMFPRHSQPLRRRGLGTDIAYAILLPLLTPISTVIGVGIALVSLAWLPGLLLRHTIALLPPEIKIVVGFLLFDLATYWVHRLNHEVPFLWRFHSIHHSSETMDWASGVRSHPLDSTVIFAPLAFLIGAGFSLRFSLAVGILKIIVGLLAHANVKWQWRPLRYVVMTPEFHHWHHSSEPDAINRNYSVFLPIWDVLFKTHFMPAGRHPVVYGARPKVPEGILAQLAHPLALRRWKRQREMASLSADSPTAS